MLQIKACRHNILALKFLDVLRLLLLNLWIEDIMIHTLRFAVMRVVANINE